MINDFFDDKEGRLVIEEVVLFWFYMILWVVINECFDGFKFGKIMYDL